MTEGHDIIIIGAGLSGINAAYRIQESLPNLTYTILEARDVLGGTWSLFKYPGIRSDSEIAGFAFTWEPWTLDATLADGGSIVRYLENTAGKHGIDKQIQYGLKVTEMEWRTSLQRWSLTTTATKSGEVRRFNARFVMMCTGYYDYDNPYKADIPGLGDFKGQTVHPQFWPADLDWTGKNVVVVGSGATSVTIVPAMSKAARHVTMLQRSPSHFLVMPSYEAVDGLSRRWLSPTLAYALIRMRILILGFLFVAFCRLMPGTATKLLRRGVQQELPKGHPVDPHFIPSYPPFEQRLCITPDGDFFQAIRDGKASIETGHIETITDRSIVLKSGKKIEEVDIIITATGLSMYLIGGVRPTVDGEAIDISKKFTWRSTCLQDIPNLCFLIGYVDNSWTLGSDSSARLFVRLIKKLESSGSTSFVPVMSDEERRTLTEVPIMNLSSNYVERIKHILPRTANKAPWKPRWHYFKDNWFAGYGNIEKGMKVVRMES